MGVFGAYIPERRYPTRSLPRMNLFRLALTINFAHCESVFERGISNHTAPNDRHGGRLPALR